ncbi:fibronectin type III domain-containing protein [Flammeovirga aprica]|uniref:T9SS type A sorting domain-containing protein n=1 Tax=Flammeovirga aprica JL-4 TaxID=694437 RepID=A0A7X9RS12_9BACT|nr:fibronectin type III domain-containing protein [Flammeovirga aprica]NME66481.1 T9SS type A sorting domain-containing protein [Flammeovirga aprica JL-4]
MKPLTVIAFFSQKMLTLIATLLFLSSTAYGQDSLSNITGEKPVYHKFKRLKDDPVARQQFEHLMLEDPITHEIPANIFDQEKAFIQNIHFQSAKRASLFSSNTPAPKWLKRGPFNVGGRTRALAIDKTNENIILAGGVAGGLWRSIDGGDSWTKVTDPTDRQSITCIAQDPRPHFSNVWYYGSGEVYGNSASGGGAVYRGNGIYKSTDGGVSWTALSGTTFDPTISGGDFQYTSSIVISDDGGIYVAHQGGISRSLDGGMTWNKVIENTSSIYTEIEKNTTGKLFATLSNHGYFISDDGENWTDITPSQVAAIGLNRTVLSASPSNPDVVYFFAHTPGKGTNSHMLFKYSVSNDTWLDRTANLPAYGGYVGNLSQGSYNQYIEVKPNDENVVFIGSTNLYRSTDGFASTANTTWIGGYAPVNNVSQYANHHPDNHAMVFLPSNSDIVITSHDGGVSKSKNIMADVVNWQFLNNGYYTTQAYAIAIDEDTEGDARIMAGFQDNGKWYTNASATDADWIEEFAGGDGCYVAIVPGEHIRYTSTQYGKILRFKGDDPTKPVDYDGIQPRNASGQLFVHPYILDPNDANVMYYPAKNKLWYNLSLSSINSGYTFNGTTTGWALYDNVSTSGTITAVAASKNPQNIVVVGTGNGNIYRINNARSKSSSVDHISSGKGLPSAFVSCVAVNPKNADHIVVVYSNYQTKSIYQTKDGGVTWTHVSGNLEENEDGSGAGPSVRWAEFHQPKDGEEGLFVGTSVGLYYSPLSSISENTEWMQQGEKEIGDGVVTMIKTREDGLVVVATHSNGIFSAYFGVQSTPPLVKMNIDERTYSLGEVVEAIDLHDVFESQNQNDLVFEVITSDSSVIKTSISNDTLYIATNTATGTSAITLFAYDNTLSSKIQFKAKVENVVPALHSQVNQTGEIYRSQFFTDFNKAVYLADDITVPEGKNWVVSKINAYGRSTGQVVPKMEVFIYEDENGQPSENIVYSSGVVDVSDYDEGILTHVLATPLELTPGKYWISVAAVMSYSKEGSWFWKGTGEQETRGEKFYLIDPGNLFGRGYTDWTDPAEFNAEDTNLAFEVFGSTTGSSSIEELTALNASLLPDENIEVSWESIPHVSGYIIERAEDIEGPYQSVAKVNSNHISWIDKSAKPSGATYYYKVKAFSAEGVAENSPVASATLKNIPNPVENLKVELQNKSRYLSVSWEDNSETEDGFYVEYSLNPEKGFVPLAMVDRNTTTYEFTNNTLGSISYYIRVTAFNGSGRSTPVTSSIFTRLEAPGNVIYEEVTPSSLLFTWEDASALETGFLIEYSTDYGKTFPHSFVTDVDEESFLIEGLTKGFTYYFRIRAINGLLEGKLNSLFQLFVHTMSNSSKPDAVEEININASENAISLAWKDNIENELGFEVLRRKVGEEEYTLSASLEYNDSTFVDLEVEKGEMYEYVIKSYNSLGSSISTSVSAQVPINAPVIMSLEKVESGHQIIWNDLSDREEHYVVYRQEKTMDFEMLAVLDSSVTSYTDSLYQLNTEYTYKVASEKNGFYYDSECKSISTVPPVPVGLTGFALDTATQHTLSLTWDDTKSDEHGYKIFRKSGSDTEPQLIASVNADARAFKDSLLAENTTYTYYIQSYIFEVYSDNLELQATTLERVIPVPSQPYQLDLIYDSLDNTISLSWSDSSEVVKGYEVYRKLKNDTTSSLIASLSPDKFQVVDTDFDKYKDYIYSIAGFNEEGYSPHATINYVGKEMPKSSTEGEDPTTDEEGDTEEDPTTEDEGSTDEEGDTEEDPTTEDEGSTDEEGDTEEDPTTEDEGSTDEEGDTEEDPTTEDGGSTDEEGDTEEDPTTEDEGSTDEEDDTEEDPSTEDEGSTDEEEDNEEDPSTDDEDNTSEEDSVIVKAPSEIEATMLDDYLRISWKDNSLNEEGFHVCYYDSSSHKKVLLGTTEKNTNVFRDRRSFAEGTHVYYLRAFSSTSESEEIKFEYTHESTTVLDNFVTPLEAKVYPNPSNGIFAVDLDENWQNGVEVSVFSTSGRKVYQGRYNSNHIQLNIAHLYAGQYIVQFADGDKSIRKSIIKR